VTKARQAVIWKEAKTGRDIHYAAERLDGLRQRDGAIVLYAFDDKSVLAIMGRGQSHRYITVPE
jgi:hypothetical protein